MNFLLKLGNVIRSARAVLWAALAGILAGILIGAVLGMVIIRRWYTAMPRPGPGGPPAVTINPALEAARPAEVHLSQAITGRLAGSVPLPTARPTHPPADSSSARPSDELKEPKSPSVSPEFSGGFTRIEAGEGGNSYPSPSIEPRASSCVWEGERLSVPLSGELETVITDARSGEELARAVQPIQGEADLEIRDGLFEIETTFTAPLEIAIDIPEEDPARNRIGILYLAGGGWGGYYRREWRLARIGGVTAMGWAGIGVLRGCPSAGIGMDLFF